MQLPRVRQSFYVQYLALMLIILCFTVGAFRPRAAVIENPRVAQIIEAIPAPQKIREELPIELRSPDPDIRNRDAQMLTSLLRAHDITATVVLVTEAGGAAVQRTILEAQTLQRELLKVGVPSSALEVEVRYGKSEATLLRLDTEVTR